MAIINPVIPTGAFLEHQDISFTFDKDVSKVAITTGDIPPSISKYIAYDTLNPPNPFLAVTEDGRGRVVYDGGFPKYYSSSVANLSATTFSQLNASCKFLHNAINWVANPKKVASGMKRILVLSDNTNKDHYNAKVNTNGGFFSTLMMLATTTGFSVIIKDISDYPNNMLNPTLAELEGYGLLIVFGGSHTTVRRFTTQAVNEIVTYRENGNGIILITDHGANINSPEEAATTTTKSGFFTTVNQIASRFGAYFSSDFNRTPVNVGFLRRTYGDHPLYANLLDSESISAGGSESKVVVSQSTLYDPDKVPVVKTTIKGMNSVNVLALMKDGSVNTARFVYIIQGDDFLWTAPPQIGADGKPVEPVITADAAGNITIDASVDGSALGTVWGEILKNGQRIGEIHYANGTSNTHIYGGGTVKARDGDVIEIRISTPFSYSKTTVVRRKEPKLNSVSKSRINANMKEVTEKHPITNSIYRQYKEMTKNTTHASSAPYRAPSIISKIGSIVTNSAGGVEYEADVYSNKMELDAALKGATVVPGKCYINAADESVWGYVSGSYQQITNLKARDIFPPPCVLKTGSIVWNMSGDGKITKA